MKNEIENIFNLFNENNVKYFVVRDYQTVDRIYNSKDIDVYVSKKDLKIVKKIFKRENWSTRVFNNNKYPHIQFFKMIENKIAFFDVVYGFYYGKDNYYFEFEESENNFKRKVDNVNISENELAVKTMLFHVLFDKGELSNKNAMVLSQIIEESKKQGYYYDKAICLLNNNSEENIEKIKKELILNRRIKKNTIKNLFVKIRIKVSDILFKITRRLLNKSIVFIGIDGSGKSTLVKTLKEIYGDKAIVVYMGLKEFKIKKVEKLVYNKNNSFINKIIKRPLLYIEMLSRYFQYRFSGKVVIFDRYVDDIVLGAKKRNKLLDIIMYKFLFPSPNIKIYVNCSVETSFSRKDDIEDKEIFKMMKKRYDKEFFDRKKVYCINTDNKEGSQTIKEVYDILNTNFKIGIF